MLKTISESLWIVIVSEKSGGERQWEAEERDSGRLCGFLDDLHRYAIISLNSNKFYNGFLSNYFYGPNQSIAIHINHNWLTCTIIATTNYTFHF